MRKEETVQGGASLGLRERQKRAREQAILEAAYDLVAESSYEAMTMDDLAVRAGISKPTLYQHFPSKEAIVVRSIMQILEEWLAAIREMDTQLSAAAKLERLVQEAIGRRLVQRRMVFGAAKLTLIPVVRSHPGYQALYHALVSEISRIIDAGKAEQAVPNRLNTRVLAQTLFSILRDCDYEEMAGRGEVARAEVVETLTRFVLGGMSCINSEPGSTAREAH